MPSDTFLILLGGLLVVAFLAEEAFRWLRVPPVLVLMACGLFLGPVTHVLPARQFAPVAPHFGALAFLLILFEGGLDLGLHSVVRGFAPGAKLALLGFAAAVFAGTGVGLVSGLPLLSAVVLGLVLAPISGAIVLPLAGRLGLSPETRALVVLEGALADVLAVLGIGLVTRLHGEGGLAGVLALGSLLAAAFSVILAVAVGLAWPRVLRAIGDRRYVDVLTFGVTLAQWGFAEMAGASGVLVVFCFGLTLANERDLLVALRLDSPRITEVTEDVVTRLHAFIVPLTFLVRAFFFVFMGVVVRFRGMPLDRYLEAGEVLVLFVATRWLVLRLLERRGVLRLDAGTKRVVWFLQPRGLVSAVLAIGAAQLDIVGADRFLAIASLVIIGSNVMMAVGLRGTRVALSPMPAAGSGKADA